MENEKEEKELEERNKPKKVEMWLTEDELGEMYNSLVSFRNDFLYGLIKKLVDERRTSEIKEICDRIEVVNSAEEKVHNRIFPEQVRMRKLLER